VGIPTGVLVAPLMPGINDSPHQVEPLLQAATDAGAQSVGGIALHLRGEVKDVFMGWLRTARPDLVERYEELYRRGAYAPPAERERLAKLARGRGAGNRSRRWSSRSSGPANQPPAPTAQQQSLF
jgi:DNA repair photolyase